MLFGSICSKQPDEVNRLIEKFIEQNPLVKFHKN